MWLFDDGRDPGSFLFVFLLCVTLISGIQMGASISQAEEWRKDREKGSEDTRELART